MHINFVKFTVQVPIGNTNSSELAAFGSANCKKNFCKGFCLKKNVVLNVFSLVYVYMLKLCLDIFIVGNNFYSDSLKTGRFFKWLNINIFNHFFKYDHQMSQFSEVGFLFFDLFDFMFLNVCQIFIVFL